MDEKDLLGQWQKAIDLMAELAQVPAGLIMRHSRDGLEVLVSSDTQDNPYPQGEFHTAKGADLYCNRVIESRDLLLVPNALEEEEWRENPDAQIGMISYLGVPIFDPSGGVFGTICLLDRKENHYNELLRRVMFQCKDLIEGGLHIARENAQLRHTNERLEEALREIKTLQGIIPICSYCKNIRDDDGCWQRMEQYIHERSEASFSHGICPACFEIHHQG